MGAVIEFSTLQDIEYYRSLLRRALKKEAIESMLFYARWVVVLIITALITATVVQGINSYLFVKTQKLTFNRAVESMKTQVSESPNITNKSNISIITEKNVFGPLGTKSAPVAPPKIQTKLPLVLIGTFMQTDDAPYAIIEDDKKKVQDVFNIGDTIFGDAKLIQIFPDKVEINRQGQTEFLTIDDAPDFSSGGGASTGSEFVVDQKELDGALQNLPLLLTQARAVPYFKDGKSVGLRMFSIKAGSMYEKIGLQNGDILKSINGNSLSDISQAMRLFETLKEERSISVTLERNREEKEVRYQIR
jgi:general secretion pathway protein C